MFFKLDALKDFTIFTGKHLCCGLILTKLQARPFEYCEIFKKNFFCRTPLVTKSCRTYQLVFFCQHRISKVHFFVEVITKYFSSDDLGGGAGGRAPSLFFAITYFFAITLKNYKLCYLK